ncbi:hypothetical protein REPUB_Repub07fG0222800 [Reevesia pubescens]
MAYNLRKRNSLNPRGTYYVESGGSDNESHDSTHSDPDYGRPPRAPRSLPNQNNVRPSNGMQRTGGIRISDFGASSSFLKTTGTVQRRRPGRPPKTDGEEDRQGRHGWRERTNSSQMPRVKVTKRTVWSWFLTFGVVRETDLVWCTDKDSGNNLHLAIGEVNGKGILCSCCSRQMTIGEFETHSGRAPTGKPYQHVVLAESQFPLLVYQIEAWEDREKEEKRTYNNIQPKAIAGDKNDDVCMICADGGDLVCCERCPSTFHPYCIFMENVPQGDWLCSSCLCKYCARGDGHLNKCSQCEKHYHCKCGGESFDLMNSPASLFCGSSCRKMAFLGLYSNGKSYQSSKLVGSDVDDVYNKVQTNCKVAVAWQVIEECFMLNIDRLTRANIVQSIVYNRGSNLTPRMDYSGFYTAVLEKNDEIICVATIRVHGKRLAEMPFIPTGEKHRR